MNKSAPHHLIVNDVRHFSALQALISAGARGCTPIEAPGPRSSDYVFRLRRDGLDIETVTETHGRPFSGAHARQVLRTEKKIVASEAS